jgi:hypothetical protein
MTACPTGICVGWCRSSAAGVGLLAVLMMGTGGGARVAVRRLRLCEARSVEAEIEAGSAASLIARSCCCVAPRHRAFSYAAALRASARAAASVSERARVCGRGGPGEWRNRCPPSAWAAGGREVGEPCDGEYGAERGVEGVCGPKGEKTDEWIESAGGWRPAWRVSARTPLARSSRIGLALTSCTVTRALGQPYPSSTPYSSSTSAGESRRPSWPFFDRAL